MDPTPRNLRYCENLRGQILREIELGIFEYAKYFPNSPKAKALTNVPGAAITVAEALKEWLSYTEPKVQHSTFIGYRRAVINVLIPSFGQLMLAKLTRGHIKNWIAEQTTSVKRINNVLTPLRGMLEEAHEDGVIESNPMEGLKVRKRERLAQSEHTIDPFSPEEIAAIINECDGQFLNLVQFAFWTGLRTSEMIGLEWKHIDWIKGLVMVRQSFVMGKMKVTKTRSGRRDVKLLYPAREALERQREYTEHIGDRVFHDPRTNAPWQGDKPIREWNWRPALRQARVRYRYPYQTRHTYASTMLSAGENIAWLSAQLGHGTVSMTMRAYARWIPDVDPNAGEKAAELWNRNKQD